MWIVRACNLTRSLITEIGTVALLPRAGVGVGNVDGKELASVFGGRCIGTMVD